MDDEQISQLLRDLPREDASPFFTAGVLHRVRRTGVTPRRRVGRRLALAASAAVMLVASVFGTREVLEQRARARERQATIARLEGLEARKQALENEIRSLRRMARDAQPVVYLGSTPNLDVVVNLRRLAERRSSGPKSIRPANVPEPASTRFVRNPNPRR